MHLALLFLAIILLAPTPAFAQDGCPNTCPEGYVRDAATGECVPIALMV